MLTFHLHFADIGIFLFDTSYLFLYASFLKQQQRIQLGIKIKDISFFLSFSVKIIFLSSLSFFVFFVTIF